MIIGQVSRFGYAQVVLYADTAVCGYYVNHMREEGAAGFTVTTRPAMC